MSEPLMARALSSDTAHLRHRESPGSWESAVRAKLEGRRQALEHAQFHGAVTQGLDARS
jgi:hypothetical protein